MAEQIISHVLSKLEDLLIKEYFFLKGVTQQVELVKIHLRQMQSFWRDAEEKKNKGDNRTRQWVRDVREVAFEIENAIDNYVVQIHNVTAKHVRIGKRYAVKIVALHKLGDKISKIQEKIRTISESRNNLGIKNLGEDAGEEKPFLKTIVVPDIDNEEIVGFEDDRKTIIDALVNDAKNKKRQVLSIVGVGGLGKTTLAHKVYNNPRVKELFDLRIWLSISQDFKPIDILRKLYEKAMGNSRMPVEEAEAYLAELNKSLSNKRYLIVLDDAWTDDVFDYLNVGFPDVGNGSRVIITTRFLNVATDPTRVFKLPFLNKEESLELLLKNALQTPNPLTNCPDELRDVAKKLAERCDGLPLAIVVLGRLLSKKPCDHAHWSQVGKNLDWYRDGEGCMNILYSSYHDLPYYLKSCFRYLACFPEDHKIEAVPLLRMWIAEGFMDHNKKGMLEDEAEHCLEELAQRSLVQVVERNNDGSIIFFRVHDLLHDLAIRESEENDFLLICKNENTQTDFKKARRVVIHNNHKVESQNQNLENIAMPNVRSFLNFDIEVPVGIKYPLLRVLELKGSRNLTKLPEELKSMIHLRYLGLENTGLKQLPETIGCLQNLQTINIWGTKVEKIPSSLWGIQALRHVTLREWLPGPPPSANLVNLQTLEYVSVPESWRDGLPHLPSLRTLDLHYFDTEENGSIVMPNWNIVITLLGTLNNLVSLFIEGDRIPAEIADVKTSPGYKHLQTLFLSGPRFSKLPYSTKFSLDTVELPRNLIRLSLWYIWFDKDPMPKLEKLPFLKSLYLWGIENVEEMVCSAGGFPQLQELRIVLVNDLKQWKVEKEAMPHLKTLRIDNCKGLSALPDLDHVKTLQELRLIEMDVLESKVKDRTGEEWQKIQHIPTIKYWLF
ncbi:hypothetical protein LUZ60_002284 [Juncus effusus]|nr:hypothetical protein LUZ60_002284 [Juncus effusus]